MRRRELLRTLGTAIAGLGLESTSLGQWLGWLEFASASPPTSTVVVAEKASPTVLVRKAVQALGGMKKFVRKGCRVVVKPNIAFARPPEGAATTHPEVVAEVVRLCFQAGAKEVVVLDHTLDPPRITYEMSGIGPAVRSLGAQVVYVSSRDFVPQEVPRGKYLSALEVKVLRMIKEADVFINVPIAKNHSSALLTLGMKNLMGTILDRGAWHNSGDLHQCIADFTTAVRPHLTLIDAVRILTTGGPKGPGRVEQKDTVIASTDIVAGDAVATTLFGYTPQRIPYLVKAQELGVGVAHLSRIKVVKV